MNIIEQIDWSLVWSEIKEVQTLIAAMFAFFAARYAYMQATRRDRERAEIIKQVALKRIFYTLGKLSVITEMPSLVLKANNETNSVLTEADLNNWKAVIKHIKKMAIDVSVSIEENRDDLLSLSSKQYKQISMVETYMKSIYDSLDVWVDSAVDVQSFEHMAQTVKSQYIQAEKMAHKITDKFYIKWMKSVKEHFSLLNKLCPSRNSNANIET